MNDKTTSSDVWYYAHEGTTFGPFTLAELQQKAAQEIVTPETLVVPQGQEEWRAYSAAFPDVSSIEKQAGTSVQGTPQQKPLSKRDKVLGYGCLLPLMICGALAFLSDFFKGKEEAKNETQAMLAADVDDNTPRPFTEKEATYLLETAAKLWTEAENESPVQEEVAAGLDSIRNARLRTDGLIYDLKTIYGYEHRLNTIGTFRGHLADALLNLRQAWGCLEETRSAKTGEALSAADRLRRISLENCRVSLGKAQDVLTGAKITHSDSQL